MLDLVFPLNKWTALNFRAPLCVVRVCVRACVLYTFYYYFNTQRC